MKREESIRGVRDRDKESSTIFPAQVEKFELSKDEYESRSGTVLDFKRKNKLGRFNPETQEKIIAQVEAADVEGEEEAKKIKKGDRCEVLIKGAGGPRRGCVMFVG